MIHTVRNILTGSPVVITSKLNSKAPPVRDGDDPFRTFSEWDSAADRKAYGRL